MKLDENRRYNKELVKEALLLEGNFLELGAGKGKTVIELAILIKELGSDKQIFACDTWEGLPYDDSGTTVESDLKIGQFKENTLEMFLKEVQRHGVEDFVVPVKGLFEETLAKELKDEKICYAYLDADLYKSTKTGVMFLKNNLVKGGIVGFHDYKFIRCPGVTKVVDEDIDRKEFVIMIEEGINIFFKDKRKEKGDPEKKESKPKPKETKEENEEANEEKE